MDTPDGDEHGHRSSEGERAPKPDFIGIHWPLGGLVVSRSQ